MKERPDLSLCQALLMSARDKAVHLRGQAGIEAMCALARTKRPAVDPRNKPGQYFPILSASLAVNMILSSHADAATWPLNFVQVNKFITSNLWKTDFDFFD